MTIPLTDAASQKATLVRRHDDPMLKNFTNNYYKIAKAATSPGEAPAGKFGFRIKEFN